MRAEHVCTFNQSYHDTFCIHEWLLNTVTTTELLTPSFQPMSGMKPMTVTVMQTMLMVAMRPTMKLCVAMMRMGSAKARPTMIPVSAEEISVCKHAIQDVTACSASHVTLVDMYYI